MRARAGDETPTDITEPAEAEFPRPLRRDAARNRQRILLAAAEVFTERGLDATLDDVARRAGVGIGTVYRRFPGKEALVEVLFTDRIDEMVAAATKACAAPDPWDGLVSYLEYAAAAMAADTGLRQMVMFATYGRDRVTYAREQLRPVIGALVARAQEAGDLRKDFSATDVPLIAFMLASVAEYAGEIEPDLWRRYLAMVIDSLRPARAEVTALPVAALSAAAFEQAARARGGRPPVRGKLPASQFTCSRTRIFTHPFCTCI
jgi:AcrR family transcriptional regulator